MKSGGSGAAANATVDTKSTTKPQTGRSDADARVAACQARVDRLTAHLAGAQEALAQAIAEQEAT